MALRPAAVGALPGLGPVPSVALSEPTWSTDRWRGATWVNLNYLIVRGLRTHGRGYDADWLSEQTVAMTQRAYAAHGVLFEFFDALGQDAADATCAQGSAPGALRHSGQDGLYPRLPLDSRPHRVSAVGAEWGLDGTGIATQVHGKQEDTWDA